MRDFLEDYFKIVKQEISKIDAVGILKTTNVVAKFASFMLGIMLIYAGMSEIMVFSHDYLDLIFFTTPVLWIVSGFILLISFGIGLLGMARENVFAIFAEGAIMLLGGILEAISRSILNSSTPKTKEDIVDLHKVFRNILATYQPRKGDHTFDILQKELSCCGVVDHQDWTWERVPADLRQKGYFANPIYPSSCCVDPNSSEEIDYFEQHVCLALEEKGDARAGLQMHAVGCLPAFVDFIKEKTDFLLPFVLVSGKRVKMR